MRIFESILLVILLVTATVANAESWYQIDTFHQKVKDETATGYFFVDSESIQSIDDTQIVRIKFVYELNPYAEAFDEVVSKLQFKCDSNQAREVEGIKYKNGKFKNRWSPLSFLNKYYEITPKSIPDRVLPIACGRTTIAQLQQERDNQNNAKKSAMAAVQQSKNERELEKNISGNSITTSSTSMSEYIYPDGNRYFGKLENGLPDGIGRITAKNGTKYEGTISRGQIVGYGVFYYPNGNRYEGEVSNGAQNGKGTFYFNDGGKIVGNFINGYPVDTAKLTDKNGNYFSGQYKQWSPYNGEIYNVSNEFIGKVVNGKTTVNPQQSAPSEGINLGQIFGAIVESAVAYQEGKNSVRKSQVPVIVSVPQHEPIIEQHSYAPLPLPPLPRIETPAPPELPMPAGISGKITGD